MDIYRVRSIAAFKTTCLQANTDYSKYLSFYYMLTVVLDQRKQKLTEFLKFLF